MPRKEDYQKYKDYYRKYGREQYQKNKKKEQERYQNNKEIIMEKRRERRLDRESRLKDQVAVARCRAKRKGLEFSISYTDLEWPVVCPILGIELDYTATGKVPFNAPSIDRKDNTKGYTKENCWVISNRANTLKKDATLDELRLLVKGLELIN